MKRFLYYFIWIIAIGFVVYMGIRYQLHLDEEAQMTYILLPSVMFATLLPIVIGLLLRLPKLLTEIKEKRPWTFDWIKLCAIGLPALYIISMSILPFTTIGSDIRIPEVIIIGTPIIQMVTGIVFGYTLLDVLKK